MTFSENHPNSTLRIKLFKRFMLVYFILYIYPYGFEYIYAIDTKNISFWPLIVPWFGETFFGWTYDAERLYIGFNSKFDYTQFSIAGLAAFIMTLLSLFFDKKIKYNYDHQLDALLKTILRYHVAWILILYGMVKVLPLQFGMIDIDTLETSIGNTSPMELLWKFMSYSRFYASTTGTVEIIGGIFLLFRPTVFLGACISLVALTNVVLIDIGYHVSVIMFAIHLLAMVCVILTDDIKAIWFFFVLNKEAKPKKPPVLLGGKKYRTLKHIIKASIIGYLSITMMFEMQKRKDTYYKDEPHSLSALYSIDTFVINNDTLAPNLTDTLRWKSMEIKGASYIPNGLKITTMDGKTTRYTFQADTLAQTLSFHTVNDTLNQYKMTYQQDSSNQFIFQGTYNEDTIWLKAKAKKLQNYRLIQHKLKWIRDL